VEVVIVQQRNLGLAILLSIVTCGIYSLYWMYVLTNEVSQLTGEKTFEGGKVILLSIITCGIYTYFWYYQLGQLIAKAQELKGKTPKDNGVLFLVLCFFGLSIVNLAIAQNDVNQLA
jgi:hypothetical protein